MSVDPDSKSKASTGNAEKYLIFLILQSILSHKHRIKMLNATYLTYFLSVLHSRGVILPLEVRVGLSEWENVK